jgi:hypothetical protein
MSLSWCHGGDEREENCAEIKRTLLRGDWAKEWRTGELGKKREP